ncbi:MAG: hypothetical protein EOO90_23895 [Pedobacter sp.]|nr:MAG: hypothetical protein EOO90_23895 [Pedobacter sp.]
MKRKILITSILVALSLGLSAQKGQNFIQVSGQIARPTSALLEFTNFGYGGAIKWMHGFGRKKQQLTLETGYNRFPLKKMPADVHIYYSAVPVYLGYRYLANKVSLEVQGGAWVNNVSGRSADLSASETRLNLGVGLGLGYYLIKNFEVGARFQVTDIRGSQDDPTFLGIRLAYDISL